MKATSKIISVVLILVLCLSVFPASAFAATPVLGASEPVTEETTLEGANTTGNVYVSPGSEDDDEELDGIDGVITNVTDPIEATKTVEAETVSELIAALSDLTVKEVDLKATEGENGNDGIFTLSSALKANHTVLLNIGSCTLKFEGGSGTGAAIAADAGAILTVTGSGKIEIPYKTESDSSVSGYTDVSFGSVRIMGTNNVEVLNLPTDLEVVKEEEKIEAGGEQIGGEQTGGEQTGGEQTGSEQTGSEQTGGDEATIITDGENKTEDAKPAVKFVIKQKEAAVENSGDPKPAAENEGDPKPAAENEGDPKPTAENEGDPKPAEGGEGDGLTNPPAEGNDGTNSPAEGADNTSENPPAEGADTVDESPKNVTEKKETELKEKVEVSAEQQAAMDAATGTIQGEDPVTGSIVIVSGVNLPEDLTVVVKPLDGVVSGLEEGEEVALAIDITILDKDGNIYEPWADPNVKAVDVKIRNKALGNLEEGEAYTLYHVVNDVPTLVSSAEKVEGENAMAFSTTSFSPFVIIKAGATGSALNGSDGEAHRRTIKIRNLTSDSDIYINNNTEPLVFEITGGAAPMAISIVDSEDANSANLNLYKAGYLLWGNDYTFTDKDGNTYIPASLANIPCPDPLYVTIFSSALINAAEGKYAVVFWYKDTTSSAITPVYMIQPVTFVNQDGIQGIGWNFDPFTGANGTYEAEKCDYDALNVLLTAKLWKFSITGPDGIVYASYNRDDSEKKMWVRIDGKDKWVNIGDYFSVGDYYETDAVGHEYIAGQTLKIHDTLLKKLPYGDGFTLTVSQKNKDGSHEDTKSFAINLAPGITVADGLVDYIKGKNVWIKFIACEPIDYDEDGTLAIWIGGQKISHDYYSISNDHKTLWIYRNLLDQLKSNNSYTLTARLWGYVWDPVVGAKVKQTWYPAQASFNILAAGSTSYRSPKTGDESNVALWVAVLVLSGGAIVALVPKKKKGK